MKTDLCSLFAFYIDIVAKILRRLPKQNIDDSLGRK